MSDERTAIQPEFEIAVAHFASALGRDRLPTWFRETLLSYGIACCKRGVALAHQRRTLKSSPWDDEETPLEIRFDDEETR